MLIDDYPYLINGMDSTKKLEFKNNKSLYLDKKYEKILKNVIKFLEDNQGKSEENYKFIYLKKKDRYEKNETLESVKDRYNLEFNEMYDKFLEKLDSKNYKNYLKEKGADCCGAQHENRVEADPGFWIGAAGVRHRGGVLPGEDRGSAGGQPLYGEDIRGARFDHGPE